MLIYFNIKMNYIESINSLLPECCAGHKSLEIQDLIQISLNRFFYNFSICGTVGKNGLNMLSYSVNLFNVIPCECNVFFFMLLEGGWAC